MNTKFLNGKAIWFAGFGTGLLFQRFFKAQPVFGKTWSLVIGVGLIAVGIGMYLLTREESV